MTKNTLVKNTLPKKISITIDGKKISCDHRTPLINVAKKMGIYIPTLCHHEALEAAGACRLCVVEEIRDGWSKFVTACNYPVTDKMVFSTKSDRVLKNRKMTVESLLARCPEVSIIKDLAKKMGVQKSRFYANDETCILCGLCTRVCSSYATTAISTLKRGYDKKIGTFSNEPPQDCVGCGACAIICPTNHIKEFRSKTQYKIWDKKFDLAVCYVDQNKCRGCGACEEACPFKVPRVTMEKGELSTCVISQSSCHGCGVCLAVCPANAITQTQSSREIPFNDSELKDSKFENSGLLVISCPRSNLTKSTSDFKDVTILELPCVGGVSTSMLIGALAKGFNGVLVLGRHQQTCRLNGSEDNAIKVIVRVNEMANLLGLGTGRILFDEPDAGRKGPIKSIEKALASISPTPLTETIADNVLINSLDSMFNVVKWLSNREELDIDATAWLNKHNLPIAKLGDKVLNAAALPYLDLLLGDLLGETNLADILKHDLELLKYLGHDAKIAIGGFRTGEDKLVAKFKNSEFFGECKECSKRIADMGIKSTLLDDLLKDTNLLDDIDFYKSNCEKFDLKMSISKEQRKTIEQQLENATATNLLIADGPADLIQYALAQRTGAWRKTNVEPMLKTTFAAKKMKKTADNNSDNKKVTS